MMKKYKTPNIGPIDLDEQHIRATDMQNWTAYKGYGIGQYPLNNLWYVYDADLPRYKDPVFGLPDIIWGNYDTLEEARGCIDEHLAEMRRELGDEEYVRQYETPETPEDRQEWKRLAAKLSA